MHTCHACMHSIRMAILHPRAANSPGAAVYRQRQGPLLPTKILVCSPLLPPLHVVECWPKTILPSHLVWVAHQDFDTRLVPDHLQGDPVQVLKHGREEVGWEGGGTV